MTTTVQLASDLFNRPNAALAAFAWKANTSPSGTLNIVSNTVEANAVNADAFYFYNPVGSWNADQYSEITLTGMASSHAQVGPGVRITNNNGYLLVIVGPFPISQFTFFKRIAGTYTAIGSAVNWDVPLQAGDTVRLSVQGTTLTAYHNGVSVATQTDSSLSTGFPGIRLNVGTGGAATDVQVGGFTAGEFSTATAIGVWQPKGVVLNQGSIGGNATVIYESNAQILSGTVFKMWCYGGASNGIYYAESNDGIRWVSYSGNPIIPDGTPPASLPRVYHIGSTYYCYVANRTANQVDLYTSTDGVTGWTLHSGVITKTQAWEGNISIITIAGQVGGTYYGYYQGDFTVTGFVGQATSTDLITWTKNPANPFITQRTSDFDWHTISGNTYGWDSAILSGVGSGGQGFRWKGATPAGNFTPLSQPQYYCATVNELAPAFTALTTSAVDPTIVEVNGISYFYYTLTQTGLAKGVALATANMTLAQIVATQEGVINAPITLSNINTPSSATDNFTRANANPIGGNWTSLSAASGWGNAQIASNVVEPSATSTNGDSYYNAITWPADQWAGITVGTAAATSQIGVLLRGSTSGAATGYRFVWSGAVGSSGTFSIIRELAGVASTLMTGSITVSVGDQLQAAVNGDNLYFYLLPSGSSINGMGLLFATAQDNNITTGAAGFSISDSAAVANVQITGFSGGGLVNAPSLVSSGQVGAFCVGP